MTPFPYDVLLPPPPYPVHRLQPSDIKVIAALGDSLTVGLRDAAPGEILLSTKMLWYQSTPSNKVKLSKGEFVPSTLGPIKGII